MNFVQLVQALHREVGAAGVAPTTVNNATGEARRLVNWIRDADQLIQSLWVDWKFLWAQDTGRNTTQSITTLAPPADLSTWDYKTFKLDGYPIEVKEWEDVKSEEFTTIESKPTRVIILPNRSLRFDPVPDAAYSFSADYFKTPTLLAADTDIPAIPAQFHNVILGRAMVFYGNHENAEEMKTQGGELYAEWLARLENHQLPNENNARFKSSGGFFEVIPQ